MTNAIQKHKGAGFIPAPLCFKFLLIFFIDKGSDWGQLSSKHKDNPRNRPYYVDLATLFFKIFFISSGYEIYIFPILRPKTSILL